MSLFSPSVSLLLVTSSSYLFPSSSLTLFLSFIQVEHLQCPVRAIELDLSIRQVWPRRLRSLTFLSFKKLSAFFHKWGITSLSESMLVHIVKRAQYVKSVLASKKKSILLSHCIVCIIISFSLLLILPCLLSSFFSHIFLIFLDSSSHLYLTLAPSSFLSKQTLSASSLVVK